MSEWYTIKNVSELDSPALVIYKDGVKQNIITLKSMIDSASRLRPHVKTSKCKETVLLMMEAGINKFKCATIAEAEMLALCNAPDVLLAYQPTGTKPARFAALIKKYPGTKFSCLTDHHLPAKKMAEVFESNGIKVPVYIDLNIGMNRTGIAPDLAMELYKDCSQMKGLTLSGLHVYDGHIRDADINTRKTKCDQAFETVEKLSSDLMNFGFEEPIIVAGGSPTFPIHAKRKKIDCSPGTFIYWDKGYSDGCPEQNFQTAALVVSRVISLPDKTKLCLDLGHKSIASENVLQRRVHFLNAPELKAIGHSEEHLVLEAGENHSFKPGDVLYGLPFHICPTVALYERGIVVENGMASGEWKTIARDRKISV